LAKVNAQRTLHIRGRCANEGRRDGGQHLGV